jgi:DNA-binding MarR family transcriptional regulator
MLWFYWAPDPKDRRRVLILLALAGKAVFHRLSGVVEAQENRLARALDGDKADALRNLLRGLLRA